MDFTPKEKIVSKKWNKELFEEASKELNANDAVATLIIGTSRPGTGASQFYIKSPPGIGLEMCIIACEQAHAQLVEMLARRSTPN